MSDPLDAALDQMLKAQMPLLADDGFSQSVLTRIMEAGLTRTRVISITLASIACELFAFVSAIALRAQLTSFTAAAILPIAISLAMGTLVLSRSIQQLFQD